MKITINVIHSRQSLIIIKICVGSFRLEHLVIHRNPAVFDRHPWSVKMSATPDPIYTVPWYPSEYPSQQEAVTVRVVRVDEMGIWVELLEYACKEGLIPLGLYTTRRTRRVTKTVKVGKLDVAVVSQVDQSKGNMDLSRQGLKEQDIEDANKRYADTRSFMNAMTHISASSDFPFPDLVRAVAYPLIERFKSAFDGLHHCYEDPSLIEGFDISPAAKKAFTDHITKLFTPQEVRVQAQFEAEVLTPAGVDALRDALVAGYDGAPESLEIHVVSPPLYSTALTVLGHGVGIDSLNGVLVKIEKRLIAVGGRYHLKEAPKEMSHDEHQKWKMQLSELANADADVEE
jgi:translation initiation factor 2 subunit 1